MNIVKCISGLPREGKTNELIETCINMMNLTIGDDNESALKPRYYFISTEENIPTILKRFHDKLMKKGFSADVSDKILRNNIEKIIFISSESKFYDTLNKAVNKHDCVFFIDMPELIVPNFASAINDIIDRLPWDVYWTRSRNKCI